MTKYVIVAQGCHAPNVENCRHKAGRIQFLRRLNHGTISTITLSEGARRFSGVGVEYSIRHGATGDENDD